MADPIADALNLTPITPASNAVSVKTEKSITIQPTDSDSGDEQVKNDFEYARKNMYDIIEQGHEAIAKLMDIADQSQHPRAYEVIANLIKTMAETNKDLLGLTKQKKELITKEETPQQQQVTNNLFVGSTAELQAMLQKKSEEGQQ
jgi:hypothetical protein